MILNDFELFCRLPFDFGLKTVPGGPIVINFHPISSSEKSFLMFFNEIIDSWRFPEVP